ncbi:MAG: RNA polymerase sigma-70 factor (ECF subfamily) [Kiritimatiellia bacterium]|jgi:RNA polymerase sigma-70 factor, ECF subfamily
MNDSETRDRVLKAALTCQPKLTAYAYSMLSDYSAAQDVVQNALVVVAQKYEDFEEGTSIMAWCRAIVRLQALTYIRKNRREQLVEDRILNDAMDAAFVADPTHPENQFRIDCLQACLAKLPERGRELLRLRYEENAAYPDMARTLDMKLEAVRKSLFRNKQQLASCVRLRLNQEAHS